MRSAYRITTPNLVLRCPEPADAPSFLRLAQASRAALAEFEQFPARNLALESCLRYLRLQRARFDRDQSYFYLATPLDGSALLGAIELERAPETGRASLAGWVHPAAGRRGLATEAVLGVAGVAFYGLGLTRLDYRCAPANQRSVELARRAGFRHEGTLRDQHGPGRDEMVFALLANEIRGSISVTAEDALGRSLWANKEKDHGTVAGI